jgi:aldehyde:ferredoxin oxidoreductase
MVAEPERFMREVDRCLRQCAQEPRLESMRNSLSNFFSDPDFGGWDSIITVRNGQNDHWEREKRVQLMNKETGVPSLRKGMRACYVCPTGCQSYMDIPMDRPYGGTKGEGFWVNTILSHACRLDISQPEAVVYSWILTNELGLDADFAGAMLAWAFELYELGKITKKDTDGLELTWGNGAAFVEMLKKLARREGIGDVLADGPTEAAREFGEGSEYFLTRIAGQPSVESFRVAKGWCLAICTSPVAGRHLRGAAAGDERFGPRPRNTGLDVAGYERQAEHIFWQARTKELEDNLGICNYCGTWSGANFMGPENFAELVSSGMGLELDQYDLMDHYAPIGRNLEKAFNSLHTGLSRKDDQPPERFQMEPVKSGPFKGAKAGGPKYDRMLDDFYRLWGWDIETGLQTRTCLEDLGLDDIADKLSRAGKLVEE